MRPSDAGRSATLDGWVHSVRDLGSVVFLLLRDFYGFTQVVSTDPGQCEAMRRIPRESAIEVSGRVALRSAPNPGMPTGAIEIAPDSIRVLGECVETPPFEVSDSLASREDARLKYRFLDLRNPRVKEKIVLRSRVASYLRSLLEERGFIEISTPILTRSSPEGARDYIVPSRTHPGMFYALPQAPQQYKQLLMVAGFDRYFQIAPCFRDEDARADRSPGEFYQLDMEMCFAGQEDVFRELEYILPRVFEKFGNRKVDSAPFARIPHKEAIAKYGTDKPDLRNPLTIADATRVFAGVGSGPFAGKTAKAIKAEGATIARKRLDALTAFARDEYPGCAFLWTRFDGERFSGGAAKSIEPVASELISALSLGSPALLAFAVGGVGLDACAGAIRTKLGEECGLIERDAFRFCWIVDFPMYELDDDGKIAFSHNPFSMPQGGLDALRSSDPLDILAYQYDIVCNGCELSSGAVRNHSPEIMRKAFELAGYSESDIKERFGALYNAFRFGAPPHAGIAPGLDRMVMLLANEPNIREVIAFPMDKNARDLLMNAPGRVTETQLKEAHVALRDAEPK